MPSVLVPVYLSRLCSDRSAYSREFPLDLIVCAPEERLVLVASPPPASPVWMRSTRKLPIRGSGVMGWWNRGRIRPPKRSCANSAVDVVIGLRVPSSDTQLSAVTRHSGFRMHALAK